MKSKSFSLLVLAAVGLMVSACGGTSSSTPPSSITPSTTTSTAEPSVTSSSSATSSVTSSNSTVSTSSATPAEVNGISVTNKAAFTGMKVGAEATIAVDFDVTGEVTNRNVTFESEDAAIAMVDSAGKVTAKAIGSTSIVVRSVFAPEAIDVITVTVVPEETVHVTSVSASSETIALTIDATHQYEATVAPENATDKTLVYASDDTAVATISDTGLITAVAEGETYVHAVSKDGGFTTTTKVVVSKVAVPVTGITLIAPSTLKVGESIKLGSTLAPADTTQTGVAYKLVSGEAATLEGDILTGLGEGIVGVKAVSTVDSSVESEVAYITVSKTLTPSQFGISDTKFIGSQAKANIASVTYDVADTSHVALGTTVTATVTFTESMSSSTLDYYLFYINGKGYALTPVEETAESDGWWSTYYTQGSVTFTMPAGDAEIAIAYSMSYESYLDAGLSIILQENDAGIKVYGTLDEIVYSTAYIYAEAPLGTLIEAFEYSTDGKNWTQTTAEYTGGVYQARLSYSSYSSDSMDPGTYYVRAVSKETGTATLTYTNAENVKLNEGPTTSGEVTIGLPLTITYAPDDDHYISDVAVVEGVETTVNSAPELGSYSNTGTIKFTMPETPVSITFTLKENLAINIAENENIVSAMAAKTSYNPTEITSIAPGQSIYVFVEAAEGYTPTFASLNGGEPIAYTEGYSGNGYFSIAIPKDFAEESVEIEITVSKAYAVTVDEEALAGGEYDLSKETYGVGQEVEVELSPANNLYEITGIAAKDHAELEIKLETTPYGTYTATFTMPDYEVILVPTIVKKEVSQVTLSIDADTEEVLSSYTISGEDSDMVIQPSYDGSEPVLTQEFLVGEALNIHLSTEYVDTSVEGAVVKLPVVYITVGDGEEAMISPVQFYSTSNGTYTLGYSYTIASTDNITIRIASQATGAAATLTATSDEALDQLVFYNTSISYYESVTLEELNQTLKVGDIIEIEYPEGTEDGAYLYNLVVKDSKGNVLNGYDGQYLVTDTALTFELQKVEAVSVGFVAPSSGCSVTLTNSTTGERYNTYYDTTFLIKKGDTLLLEGTCYSYVDYVYEVTITAADGTELFTFTMDNEHPLEYEFTPDQACTITFTDVTPAE